MVETCSNENLTYIPLKPFLDGSEVSEYMIKYSKGLQQNNLRYVNPQEDRGVIFSEGEYQEKQGLHAAIDLFGIPSAYLDSLLKYRGMSVVIFHCANSPNSEEELHSSVQINCLNPNTKDNNSLLNKVLRALEIEDIGDFVPDSGPITLARKGIIRPPPTELLVGKNKGILLNFFGLAGNEEESVKTFATTPFLIDNTYQDALYNLIYLMIDNNFLNLDSSLFGLTPYQKELNRKGLGPYFLGGRFDKYKQKLLNAVNMGKERFNALSTAERVAIFASLPLDERIARLPVFYTQLRATYQDFKFKPDSVLTYRDFRNKLQKLVSDGTELPSVPEGAKKLRDLANNLSGIVGWLSDGKSDIAISFSGSSSYCKKHLPQPVTA